MTGRAMRDRLGSALERDMSWLAKAACRDIRVDPEIFWAPEGIRNEDRSEGPPIQRNGQRANRFPLAAHVCWSHCSVRAECLAWSEEEVAARTLYPCLAGGVRWVAGRTKDGRQTGRSNGQNNYATMASKRQPDPSARNCPLCQDGFTDE
jgi:hypothetical protein